MQKPFTVALIPISLFILLVIPISFAHNASAQTSGPTQGAVIVCAGNTPPSGTVITATGSSPVCSGSCQARKVQPVNGDIMIICAQQPIPPNYVLESVTSTPQCKCLGDHDNAYVIRLSTHGQSNSSQYGEQQTFRVGN